MILQAKLSTELCYGNFGCTVTGDIPVLSKTMVRVSKCTKVTKTPTPTSNCFNSNGGSSGGKGNTTIDGGGIKWSDLFTTTKMPPHSTIKSRKYCCIIMGNQSIVVVYESRSINWAGCMCGSREGSKHPPPSLAYSNFLNLHNRITKKEPPGKHRYPMDSPLNKFFGSTYGRIYA